MADGIHVVAAAPTRAGYGAPEQAWDTGLLVFAAVDPGLGQAHSGTNVIVFGEA